MRSIIALVLSLSVLVDTAHAGQCDGWLRRAERAEGDDLVEAYERLAACDAELGRAQLWTFMKQAKTLDTLTLLARAGVEHDAFNDLWKAMDELAYDQRAPLAKGIGAVCKESPKVLTMLQGAYVALKGSAFTAWGPAMEACGSDELVAWMQSVVKDPPKSEYNAQYNAMLTSLVDLRGPEALPVLEAAAVAAAEGGPLTSILDMMQRAIQPSSMRDAVDPALEAKLAEALVRVAEQVGPEPARAVADQLYTAGREKMAAGLLPRIYPDAVQSDGGMMWGAASLEVCEDKAVVHWATWIDAPPSHWAVLSEVEAPMRDVKAKLKCDGSEWVVRTTEAPVADADVAKVWAEGIAQELEAGEAVSKVKVVLERKAF